MQVEEAADKEWSNFKEERAAGVEEITAIRRRVAEEDARQKTQTNRRPSPDVQRPGPEDDVKMGDADSPTKEAPVKSEKEKGEEKAPKSAASSITAPSEPSKPTSSTLETDKEKEEEEGAPGLSATPPKESAAMDVDDDASKAGADIKAEPTSPQKVVEKAPEPIKEPAPPAAAAATDEDDAVEY